MVKYYRFNNITKYSFNPFDFIKFDFGPSLLTKPFGSFVLKSSRMKMLKLLILPLSGYKIHNTFDNGKGFW